MMTMHVDTFHYLLGYKVHAQQLRHRKYRRVLLLATFYLGKNLVSFNILLLCHKFP
jgi:hypothetical protein